MLYNMFFPNSQEFLENAYTYGKGGGNENRQANTYNSNSNAKNNNASNPLYGISSTTTYYNNIDTLAHSSLVSSSSVSPHLPLPPSSPQFCSPSTLSFSAPSSPCAPCPPASLSLLTPPCPTPVSSFTNAYLMQSNLNATDNRTINDCYNNNNNNFSLSYMNFMDTNNTDLIFNSASPVHTAMYVNDNDGKAGGEGKNGGGKKLPSFTSNCSSLFSASVCNDVSLSNCNDSNNTNNTNNIISSNYSSIKNNNSDNCISDQSPTLNINENNTSQNNTFNVSFCSSSLSSFSTSPASFSSSSSSCATIIEDMLNVKRKLENDALVLQKRVVDLEASYLAATADVGNILRGWDGYISQTSNKSRKCQGDKSTVANLNNKNVPSNTHANVRLFSLAVCSKTNKKSFLPQRNANLQS